MRPGEFLSLDLKERFGKTKHEAWEGIDGKLRSGNLEEARELTSIRDCYEIQGIVNKLNLLNLNASLGRRLDEPCEKCGEKEVYCGYIDLSFRVADSYDNFWHLCLNCLDASYSETHTGIGPDGEGAIACPFCSYHWYAG